ncbi:2-oxoglutarate dehydrogenase complex dihydrolipoyllysine-residue succinyltransferase [Haliangium ochraceum]|uniref:Dihydrolipoyllysine-residue succinyltransferase component of 2-oxoglutarate dehydrogenase complex n=1 Tax=Haliangium ochraceum (strain DSM 14365 / JCM 11303 / SMP-2) TaxID=502025 RepID=D0LVC3_HALO1|nr:2-oxoglutarate dehydrogenase complex dihydrolipoyllysine-residue succinyltransferase [Haliangium ochraceum]ACY17484.1 2-oxoglutarate dehydrogenase, E2 subunit, dihydrolipoamide succinyltransferase [Haliangium ochraceum DSM 14365]
MTVEIKVPSAGESITEVFIGTWLKNEGDSVTKDETLVEVETDKATMEVPAPVSGTLVNVLKKSGDSASVGEVIAHIEEGEVSADAGAASKSADKADTGDKGDKAADGSSEGEPRVMPAAQRLLDENGLDAGAVEATGPGGRLLKEDVLRHLESAGASAKAKGDAGTSARPASEGKASANGGGGGREEEVVAMSPLRRTIARRLVEAQQNAALLTTFNEVDMSAVMALRAEHKERFEKRYGVRLGFMSFFVKAAVDALKQFPQINAEVREQSIVYKNYYDIAVAVSGPKGLVTPVLRNTERMSFADVEKTIGDFGQRAQKNKLTPDELRGGTFTISNGGVFGSLLSTPIINPPQSGVLGMHAIQERPVAIDGQVVIRPMMYLALSYDHRIVDGREAVTFLKRIKEAVESPARMLLEI